MKATILTEQYAVPRPLDQFAKHFLDYLDDWFYVHDNVKVETAKYLKNVKVYDATDRFWQWLLKAREEKMDDGSPNEYNKPVPREDVDAISIPPVGKHRKTGQMYYMPAQVREEWYRDLFPAHLARQFAPYDGLIFMHKPERWAQAFILNTPTPPATKQEVHWAKRHVIAEAPFRVTSHECLHLCQKIAGGTMPQWNPANTPDPAEELFDSFIDQITMPAFETLYVFHDGPRADVIDL